MAPSHNRDQERQQVDAKSAIAIVPVGNGFRPSSPMKIVGTPANAMGHAGDCQASAMASANAPRAIP